jgi:hypothetical protein
MQKGCNDSQISGVQPFLFLWFHFRMKSQREAFDEESLRLAAKKPLV